LDPIRKRGENRLNNQRPSRPSAVNLPSFDVTDADRAHAAEYIGATTRILAKQARAAGLTMLGLLLEQAAMTAGTEAITAHWPKDNGSP
jgi:hypothetical protein